MDTYSTLYRPSLENKFKIYFDLLQKLPNEVLPQVADDCRMFPYAFAFNHKFNTLKCDRPNELVPP